MTDFRSLETFLWVSRLGSFNAAAQKLNTTQPAISQRIAQLEDQLGVRVLNRDSRHVALTATGRVLLGYAERLLGLRSEMIATVRDRTAIRGTIRIGLSETIVHTWLPRFVQEVKRTYPGLILEIDVDISPVLRQRLLVQEIDLAFLIGPLAAETEMRNRFLCTHPVIFVASPALAVPDPATIHDLASFPIFTFPRKTMPYEVVRSLFTRHDITHVNLNASASLATVRMMALESLGIAVLPPEIVMEDLENGRLVRLNTDVTVPDFTFYASWLVSPDTITNELLVQIAVNCAQGIAAEG